MISLWQPKLINLVRLEKFNSEINQVVEFFASRTNLIPSHYIL